MNPGRIPNVMILVGTSNVSRGTDEEEARWDSMMVCLFTTLWQKFNCAVLTSAPYPFGDNGCSRVGNTSFASDALVCALLTPTESVTAPT